MPLSSSWIASTDVSRSDLTGASDSQATRAMLVDLGVNPLLGVPQETALAQRAHREDLGNDRQRDLLLRVCSDVEATRAVDPVEHLLPDTGLEQPLPAALLIATRSERPDVERIRLESADERRLVELVVV